MKAYMQQVKQTQLNEEMQIAKNKMLREAELYNLSEIEMMNKLKQLQDQLKDTLKPTAIPFEKTEAKNPKPEKEKYGMILFTPKSKSAKQFTIKTEFLEGVKAKVKTYKQVEKELKTAIPKNLKK
jgi:hypothetical protein